MAEVPTELFATTKQGIFIPEANTPTSGAGVNSGLLRHQLFKRRYISPSFKIKYKQFSSNRKTSLLIQHWSLIKNDPWVCQTIKAYHIEFTQTPVQVVLPPLLPFSEEETCYGQ